MTRPDGNEPEEILQQTGEETRLANARQALHRLTAALMRYMDWQRRRRGPTDPEDPGGGRDG